jgi:hypothetical protein
MSLSFLMSLLLPSNNLCYGHHLSIAFIIALKPSKLQLRSPPHPSPPYPSPQLSPMLWKSLLSGSTSLNCTQQSHCCCCLAAIRISAVVVTCVVDVAAVVAIYPHLGTSNHHVIGLLNVEFFGLCTASLVMSGHGLIGSSSVRLFDCVAHQLQPFLSCHLGLLIVEFFGLCTASLVSLDCGLIGSSSVWLLIAANRVIIS